MSITARRLRLIDDPRVDGDDRTDYQRDRDIVLYSSAFRRLSGITQVASAETGHVFHNRLTHTLQVAQVGRRLAEKLKLKQQNLAELHQVNEDAVEAACLAHDLGHPPFGHLAETTLNRLVGDDCEGFEGNAQSFRIISELAFRSTKFSGLNLTWLTLQGVLKYPWTFAQRPAENKSKWGAYGSEISAFTHATGDSDGGPLNRSVNAELMDWADDLTYSIHDVEDFYRAGLIPMHLLQPPEDSDTPPHPELEKFLEYVESRRHKIPPLKSSSKSELAEIFREIIFAFFTLEGPFEGTKEDRGKLRTFTGQLVGRYINGLSLLEKPENGKLVKIRDGYEKEVALLKQLTWCYVIDAHGLALQQHAQKQIIKYLFVSFMNETRQYPSRLLPAYFKDRLRDVVANGSSIAARKRLVSDLVAGMTESQAMAVYQRMNGITAGSALDRILV